MERVKLHKKIQTGLRKNHKHNIIHHLNKRLKSNRNKKHLNKKHLKKKNHVKKMKDIIKKKKKHRKLNNKKKIHKRKHLKKKKQSKKQKKRKLKIDIVKKHSGKTKKRKLSGPKATPNVAVDDTKVQIRTFTRLPKQTPIINNALSTGTKIIQPRIYLPSNQYTKLI